MKQLAKRAIVNILGWQVRRLQRKADFKVIAVAGSIGKTSTKFSIATVLSQSFRVQHQAGNYNDIVSVPLVFFGRPIPSLLNPLAWARTFLGIEKQLRSDYPYDVVVLEVGTDFPGNIAQFKQFLRVDVGVLTAITPEHMEFFDDLDQVADEELTIAEMSEKMLVSTDLCERKYRQKLPGATTYGTKKNSTYRLGNIKAEKDGFDFTIDKEGKPYIREKHASVAETQLYSITAAVAVADMLGMKPSDVRKGIAEVKPVSGRMLRLDGIKQSTILDDTYNASPEASIAALNTLYKIPATQKIALMGNMNELGRYSAKAHREVGAYCDASQLDLVVTLGPDANQHLATAALGQGCKVSRADTPLEAADIIKQHLKEGSLILAKGSQNRVYAEEAVKQLLANPKDSKLLVRQSPAWMKKKREWLGKLS